MRYFQVVVRKNNILAKIEYMKRIDISYYSFLYLKKTRLANWEKTVFVNSPKKVEVRC